MKVMVARRADIAASGFAVDDQRVGAPRRRDRDGAVASASCVEAPLLSVWPGWLPQAAENYPDLAAADQTRPRRRSHPAGSNSHLADVGQAGSRKCGHRGHGDRLRSAVKESHG